MSLFGAFPEPHTLSQFARRAGISEGRARALYADGKLPRPDQSDAGGRPLWSATKIDSWCKQTGRPLGEKGIWLHRVAPADEPAPVLFNGIIEHKSGFSTVPVYAIVWDTPHGHIVYLTPVYDESGGGGGHADGIARAAASLVRPAFWSQALVVQPISGDIGTGLINPIVNLNLYQLASQEEEAGTGSAGSWFRRLRPQTAERPGSIRNGWAGMIEASDVASVIGAPVPVWIDGTCTKDAVSRALAYNSTFTVPDHVTDWPPARDQVQAALGADMPSRFPAGFAALAAQARATYEEVLALHARQRDEGDGWYLVARPAPPELPFSTEVAITAAEPSTDADAVALELTQLRDVEANLDADAPEGDAYETAVELLTWQLREQNRSAATGRTEIYGDSYGGPVIEQWRRTLTAVPAAASATRRVEQLLNGWSADDVVEILRDSHDMYVAVLKNEQGETYFQAEWPYDLPQGWNERTIIAADHDTSGAVFALTPTASGQMAVDPLPLEPRTGPSFGYGYGYGGGSPYTLYQALIRCALGTPEASFSLTDVDPVARDTENTSSPLWRAIATTQGPLRLPWPDVVRWAKADAARAGRA
jgi:hypothetical protein